MSLFNHPASLRAALLVIGVTSILLGYLIARARRRKRRLQYRGRQAQGTAAPGVSLQCGLGEPEASGSTPGGQSTAAPPSPNWQAILEARPSLAATGLRGSLVLLALVVALGFVLILLPQTTVQKITLALQATRAADIPPERVALLYLGDETDEKGFHIRGLIRNISSQPIEKLDASVRLYSTDGALLETVVVRMDQERISPDAISELHLTYLGYTGQFGSYSVDFKLRNGEPIPYKDRRGSRYIN